MVADNREVEDFNRTASDLARVMKKGPGVRFLELTVEVWGEEALPASRLQLPLARKGNVVRIGGLIRLGTFSI